MPEKVSSDFVFQQPVQNEFTPFDSNLQLQQQLSEMSEIDPECDSNLDEAENKEASNSSDSSARQENWNDAVTMASSKVFSKIHQGDGHDELASLGNHPSATLTARKELAMGAATSTGSPEQAIARVTRPSL